MIIYIRDVQNLGFGQAFLTEDNSILSLAQQIATIVSADYPIDMVCYVKNMDIAVVKNLTDLEI